eukprot:7041041-Prymnesium_polylepis.1
MATLIVIVVRYLVSRLVIVVIRPRRGEAVHIDLAVAEKVSCEEPKDARHGCPISRFRCEEGMPPGDAQVLDAGSISTHAPKAFGQSRVSRVQKSALPSKLFSTAAEVGFTSTLPRAPPQQHQHRLTVKNAH